MMTDSSISQMWWLLGDELVISLNGQTWSGHATNNFKHEMFWERFSILEVGANINKVGIKSKRAPLGHLHLASSLGYGFNKFKIYLITCKDTDDQSHHYSSVLSLVPATQICQISLSPRYSVRTGTTSLLQYQCILKQLTQCNI